MDSELCNINFVLGLKHQKLQPARSNPCIRSSLQTFFPKAFMMLYSYLFHSRATEIDVCADRWNINRVFITWFGVRIYL